jgi:class 3 adenylate cyclase/tetratricopeptide (TPR) repeat protein
VSERCPGCLAESPVGARFCHACGRPLPTTPCARCGAEILSGAPRCRACGAPRPLRSPRATGEVEGERKQVTVLFCDVVGSTAIAEAVGPEAMHELMREFFEISRLEVAHYGGTMDKFLGDGFVALVGAPVALEDHARRAVMAAIGIREQLSGATLGSGDWARRIDVRMGLNSGLVVVGAVGEGGAGAVTAIGDTVNIASRLEELGEPGEILVSSATARAVQSYVRTESLGELRVRGHTLPVEAHRVVGPGSRRSPLAEGRPVSLTRFVGREGELAALNRLLARACHGGGQAVSLEAEPGMGKTRLIIEFRNLVERQGLIALEGRCVSHGKAVPWLPLGDLVRTMCSIQGTDSPATTARRVRDLAAAEGADDPLTTALLLGVLGVTEVGDALARLSPEAIRTRTFDALLGLLARMSKRGPILIVIEDLHWIDRLSEDFLALLAERLVAARIMLVSTYRPGYRPPWNAAPHHSRITIPALSATEARSIASDLLADQGSDAGIEVVVDRGEGNPFFIEELARGVREVGQTGATVPATVHDVLAARIDRLDVAPRVALRTASVLGREFSLPLLEAIWDSEADLGAAIDALQSRQFIVANDVEGRSLFAFRHALTQEVAYEALLTGRRRRLHEAAGSALEQMHMGRLDEIYDLLAHHYSRTERADKAVLYLERLAEKAAGTYAHAEASVALTEALRHADRLSDEVRVPWRTKLVLAMVASMYFTGRFGESLQLLLHHEADVEALGSAELAGRYQVWLGHTYQHLGDHDGASRAIARALSHAEPIADLPTIGRAHYVLAREAFWRSRLTAGVEHGRRAVSALRGTDDWWWLAHAHCQGAGNLCNLGRFDESLTEVSAARELGERHGDSRILSYAGWVSGWVKATRGEWEAGLADCTESVETSPDRLNSAFGMGCLGFAHREGGDLGPAITHLERAIELLTEAGYSRMVAWFSGWLAEAYLLAGDDSRGRTTAEGALLLSRELTYPWGVAVAERVLGRVALAQGDADGTERHLQEALRRFASMGARFDACCVMLSIAHAARLRGDEPRAAELLRGCRRVFAELGVSAPPGPLNI